MDLKKANTTLIVSILKPIDPGLEKGNIPRKIRECYLF